MTGKWSPQVREAVERAERMRRARMDGDGEDEAVWRLEAAEMDLDVDRRDFDADGRL